MENKKINVEETIKNDLHQYLTSIDRVDQHLPEAPDLEALWAKIGESYLPDALREFNKFPTVSLGWIMFVGMALAKYWDEDWELYNKVEDHYKYLRDRIDFDHMDDYICEKVLLLDETRGTEEAFRGFIAALHQMYLMGIAIELKDLGYHMTQLA